MHEAMFTHFGQYGTMFAQWDFLFLLRRRLTEIKYKITVIIMLIIAANWLRLLTVPLP